MSSQSQIDANRANAQHSSGPKSPEGKDRSSLNPLVHGLARTKMFLPGEEPEEFTRLRNVIAKRYRCFFLGDAILVDDLALAWWKIRRSTEWQTEVITASFADLPVPAALARLFGSNHETAMTRLQRYETSARSAMYRAIIQLRAVLRQREAAERNEQAAKVKQMQSAVDQMLTSRKPCLAPEDAELDYEQLEDVLQNRANPISTDSEGPEGGNSGPEAGAGPEIDPDPAA